MATTPKFKMPSLPKLPSIDWGKLGELLKVGLHSSSMGTPLNVQQAHPMTTENSLQEEQRLIHQASPNYNPTPQPPVAAQPAPAPAPSPEQAAAPAPSGISDFIAALSSQDAPTVPAAQPSQNNDLLAALLATLPAAPNRDSYLAPYTHAEQTANGTYQAAVPVITGAYDQLRQALTQQQASSSADLSKRGADAAAAQKTLQDQIAAQFGNVGSDLQKQGVVGTPLAAVDAMRAAQQAALTQQAGQQAGMFTDMGARSAQSNNERQQTAGLAQTAALANSKNNLDSILGEIGVRKAGAERQYQSDLDSRGRQEAALRLQFAQGQAAQAADAAKQNFQMALQDRQFKQQTALQMAQAAHQDARDKLASTKQQQSLISRALVSPRDQFDAGMPDRSTQYPKATKAFNEIIKSAGNAPGGKNLSNAMTILNGMQTDPKGFAKSYGFVPDAGTFSVLNDWLKAFYDNNKSVVDQDKLAALGFDASQLDF